MSDPEFWTRVTTPTNDDSLAAKNVIDSWQVFLVGEGLAADVAAAVLALAAPRIVAEAYREAASHFTGDVWFQLRAMATEAEQRNTGATP